MGLWGKPLIKNQQAGLQRKPNLENPALHPGPVLLDVTSGFCQALRGHTVTLRLFARLRTPGQQVEQSVGSGATLPGLPPRAGLAVSVALGRILDLLSLRFFSC